MSKGLERHASWVARYPCLEHDGSVAAEHWVHWVHRYPCFADAHLRAAAGRHRPARELLYLPSMSKTRKRSKHGVVDRSATTDVVSQLECAIKNPHAALIGALIGGLVPWFGRTLAHEEIPMAWSSGNDSLTMILIAVVLGCACFSAISVYKFGRAAFGDLRKAIGFVLALEGVMLVSHGDTSNVALAVLILINAVANGSVIALAREATNRRREADARRAATRVRGRSVSAKVPPVHRGPITVVDSDAAAKTKPAPAPFRWNRATLDNVIDAEIVSEEKLLS